MRKNFRESCIDKGVGGHSCPTTHHHPSRLCAYFVPKLSQMPWQFRVSDDTAQNRKAMLLKGGMSFAKRNLKTTKPIRKEMLYPFEL